ncbi:MAG: IPT/TIG domain-containing protein [Mycobacterium leprae]
MTQPAPPPFTAAQQTIIDSYQRLTTLVAGPPPAGLAGANIPTRPPGPRITGLSPATGSPGTIVEITGTDLIPVIDRPINVFFGTAPSEFSVDERRLRAQVPQINPGRVRVAVETDCGTALSPDEFTVEAGPLTG